jgi:hypothetical protein
MVPGACDTGSAPNPKEASPSGSPMTCFGTGGDTAIDLVYAPACGALDHAVYRGTGPIATGLEWTDADCSLGNTGRATFDPGDPAPGSFSYFVIVGQHAGAEGSFGRSFDGTAYHERPEAVGVGACDRPQDLTGSCP